MKTLDLLETPEWVYKPLGPFDLDPCAGPGTKIAASNYRLFDGQNGLSLPWSGFVWCNPPFSQKDKWIDLMIEHGNGILLLPERLSAPWAGPLAVKAGHRFTLGKKINFIGGPSSNNLGSILFLFGAEAIDRVLSSGLPGLLDVNVAYTPRP